MNLLSLTNVSLGINGISLFEDVTFGIDSGEHIGFIGPNGAGKSTFISMLMGTKNPDEGKQYRRNGLKVARLDQVPQIPKGATVADLVFNADNRTAMLARQYESLLANFDQSRHKELESLLAKMEKENAWNVENEYHSFLSELGIQDLSRDAKSLSGGELRKADMARVLSSNADIFLLDEPTNHLDLETVEWLERWLKNGKHTYLLVTHDRSFLDRSCDTILELDNKRIRKYPGNWSVYVETRAKRLEEEEKSSKKTASLLRNELKWASRQPKARSSKDKKRINRIDDLQNSIQADRQRLTEFSARGRRLGKKVLELVNIQKSWGNRPVISPFSYSFRRGERIGVAGPNGAGKTTLISLIAGLLKPDSGRIDVGTNTRFAILDQSPLVADEECTVIDYIREEAENIRMPDDSLVSVVSWLKRFGFSPADQRRKIRFISGGERRRLQIVRILMSEPNFLILDEPTNDLDLASLELLEKFLESYEGCLILVSHDRTFLECVVDYFFFLDGNGSIRGFSGTWSEYRNMIQEQKKVDGLTEKHGKTVTERNRKPRSGLSYNEKITMEKRLNEIEALENELASLEQVFVQKPSDRVALAEAGRRYNPLKQEIAKKTEQWESLASRDVS